MRMVCARIYGKLVCEYLCHFRIGSLLSTVSQTNMESSRHEHSRHHKRKKKHKHHHKYKHKASDPKPRHKKDPRPSESDSDVEWKNDSTHSRPEKDSHRGRAKTDSTSRDVSRGSRCGSSLADQDVETSERKQNLQRRRPEEDKLELNASCDTSYRPCEVSTRNHDEDIGRKAKRRTYEEDLECRHDVPSKKKRACENFNRLSERRDMSSSGSVGDSQCHEEGSRRKSECSWDQETDSDGDSDHEKMKARGPVPEYEFDWEAHRYVLDRMFFREEDFIRRCDL